jgi:1-acyl-sn-glycerol-3-phosphate acyltransferase
MSGEAPPCSALRARLDHRLGFFCLGVLFRLFFRLYGRWKIVGIENVPRTGAVIFACNHASYIDPPLGWAAIWGYRKMYGVAKAELWKRPSLAYILNCMSAIPVRRHTADRAMLRRCLEVLACGETVGIFPEGTRTYDGLLNPAEPGLGLLYQKTQAPIVPLCLIGNYEMLPRKAKRLKRVPLIVAFGKPLEFDKSASREEIGAAAMREIARLMTENGRPMEPPAPERAALLPKEDT